jgi:hypothetical protein
VEQISPQAESVTCGRPTAELIGYADRISVEPGASISFMVSSSLPSYQASVVRLIHGDENPEGPGFRFEAVPAIATANYRGRIQLAVVGSYARVPAAPELSVSSFTLQAPRPDFLECDSALYVPALAHEAATGEELPTRTRPRRKPDGR